MALTKVSRGLLNTSIVDNGTDTAITIDSSNRVGIGTANPDYSLTIFGDDPDIRQEMPSTSSSNLIQHFFTVDGVQEGQVVYNKASGSEYFGLRTTKDITFQTGGSAERMRIDSSGRVGIGTSSPIAPLDVRGTTSGGDLATFGGSAQTNFTKVSFNNDTLAGNAYIIAYGSANAQSGNLAIKNTSGDIFFTTSNAEHMRIDYYGNMMVGKTSIGTNTVGFQVLSTGKIAATVPGQETAIFNRKTSDGDVIQIRKDDTIVGSIGTSSSGLTFASGGSTERMRIDSSGRVGIGTSSLDANLVVNETATSGTDHVVQRWKTQRGGVLSIACSDLSSAQPTWQIRSGVFEPIAFHVSGYERMRIDSFGNLLVGTTSDVVSDTSGSGFSYQALSGYLALSRDTSSATAAVQYLNRTGADGECLQLRKDGSTVGSISITSSSTAYNTSSDYRLKENVVELTGATERLKQLKPSRFNFIADTDTTVDGFLAHEVSDIVPEAITGTKDAVDEDGNPEYQGIDQSKLVPLLVATIQELEARITELENS